MTVFSTIRRRTTTTNLITHLFFDFLINTVEAVEVQRTVIGILDDKQKTYGPPIKGKKGKVKKW
jgi:hypothetical protein